MTGLLLLLLAATPAWEERGVDEGIAVFTREVEGHDAKEIRAIGRVEAPPAEVFAALIDVPHMVRNRPHTVEARLVERTGPVLRYYQRLDPPIVTPRDYVLEGRLSRVGADGYRLTYRAVTDRRVPPREGVVRLELIQGSWTVEPASGGKASRVTYQVLTDAKSTMPAFVANRAALGGTKDVFLKLREVVALPEYRGAKPLMGDEALVPGGGAAPAAPAPGVVPGGGAGAASPAPAAPQKPPGS